jgi:hypothetical protein
MERITVLASSHKHGGICLAGKCTDGRWVRPVSHGKAPGWTTASLGHRLGRIPVAGDRVAVPCLYPTPLGHQTENFIVGTGIWSDHGHASRAEIERMAESSGMLWNVGQSSAGGINDRVDACRAVDQPLGSLRLIRPQGLRLVGSACHAKFRLRAEFDFQGYPYRLCVTDIAAIAIWKERLAGGHSGNVEALLCISLGLPLDGYCYKLVAGMIELH